MIQFFLFCLLYVAFPSKSDAIFQHTADKDKNIIVESSGSIGFFYEGKCHKTFPNETLTPDIKSEWCSNVGKSKTDFPWISYSMKEKAFKITGYSIRNGCCYYGCCCIDDSSFIDGAAGCCCNLYSFSLQGSNDNKTWKTIHKVEKENNIGYCESKTYEFKQTQSFVFIRFVQDEPRPGCQYCMQVNQLELYGETVASSYIRGDNDDDENEESVSIIGKVKKDY